MAKRPPGPSLWGEAVAPCPPPDVFPLGEYPVVVYRVPVSDLDGTQAHLDAGYVEAYRTETHVVVAAEAVAGDLREAHRRAAEDAIAGTERGITRLLGAWQACELSRARMQRERSVYWPALRDQMKDTYATSRATDARLGTIRAETVEELKAALLERMKGLGVSREIAERLMGAVDEAASDLF